MPLSLKEKVCFPCESHVTFLKTNRKTNQVIVGTGNECFKIQPVQDGRGTSLSVNCFTKLFHNCENFAVGKCIKTVAWCEKFNYLTVCFGDESLIVTFSLGSSAEITGEVMRLKVMGNICDAKWSFDCQLLCVACTNGTLIVQSLKGVILKKTVHENGISLVQWSPDSSRILCAARNGLLLLCDTVGNLLNSLRILGTATIKAYNDLTVTGISWYGTTVKSRLNPSTFKVAVSYVFGYLYLLEELSGKNMLLYCTNFEKIASVEWSDCGFFLAVAGMEKRCQKIGSGISIYNANGGMDEICRIEGDAVVSSSWNFSSNFLTVATTDSVYFYRFQNRGKLCSFGCTIAVVVPCLQKPTDLIFFYNIKTKKTRSFEFPPVLCVSSIGSRLCIASLPRSNCSFKAFVTICTATGSVHDSAAFTFVPIFLQCAQEYVVVASHYMLCIWNSKLCQSNEYAFRFLNFTKRSSEELDQNNENPGKIHSIAVSNVHVFVIGETKGIHLFSLETGVFHTFIESTASIEQIIFNCNQTKLYVLYADKSCSLYNLHHEELQFVSSKMHVWTVLWASDDPDVVLVFKRTGIYVTHEDCMEEMNEIDGDPVLVNEHCVYTVSYGKFVKSKSSNLDEFISSYFTRAYLVCKDFIEDRKYHEALKHAAEIDSTFLCKFVGDSALKISNFKLASRAYVCAGDVYGFIFTHWLMEKSDKSIQRAKVFEFLGLLESAENCYISSVHGIYLSELYKLQENFDRYIQTVTNSCRMREVNEAYRTCGERFKSLHMWDLATRCFMAAESHENTVDCLFYSGKYNEIRNMIELEKMNEKSLQKAAHIFDVVGFSADAAKAYMKCGMVDQAINICLKNQNWQVAHFIAEAKGINIFPKLAVEVQKLEEHRRFSSLCLLYYETGQYLKAAKLLAEIAKNLKTDDLILKKIYVLFGLIVDKLLQSNPKLTSFLNSNCEIKDSPFINETQTNRIQFMDFIKKYVEDSGVPLPENFTRVQLSDKHSNCDWTMDENATEELFSAVTFVRSQLNLVKEQWRGAEAYHFLIMAKSKLKRKEFDSAFRVSLLLHDYADLLPHDVCYSLTAYCALKAGAFQEASNSFTKLESSEFISSKSHEIYQTMARRIFEKQDPVNLRPVIEVDCPKCSFKINEWTLICPNCREKFSVCIASGEILTETPKWSCTVCKHVAGDIKMFSRRSCPLCHTRIQV